jgi:hypothetical protein
VCTPQLVDFHEIQQKVGHAIESDCSISHFKMAGFQTSEVDAEFARVSLGL